MLPWGAPLLIEPDEWIGSRVWLVGVHDLVVAETLLRLTDPGEHALDAGANIGFMTSVLAATVGSSGRVTSFEPLPTLVAKLRQNIDLWHDRLACTQITVIPVALSDEEGEASLMMPSDFAQNQGLATLEPGTSGESGEEVRVATRTLDAIFSAGEEFGVMKLDVEGHEYSVLKGSVDLLSGGRIRDIVFEEHNTYPNAATRLLESHGYEVFGLRKGMFGPELTPPADLKKSLKQGEPPNYLATRDASRAARRLRPYGWRALAR